MYFLDRECPDSRFELGILRYFNGPIFKFVIFELGPEIAKTNILIKFHQIQVANKASRV